MYVTTSFDSKKRRPWTWLLLLPLILPLNLSAGSADAPEGAEEFLCSASFKCPNGDCTDDFPAFYDFDLVLDTLEIMVRTGDESTLGLLLTGYSLKDIQAQLHCIRESAS